VSSILSNFTFDGSLNAFQIRAAEARVARLAQRGVAVAAASTLPFPYTPANPAVAGGATAYYVLMRTSKMQKAATLRVSSSTAFILYWRKEG
jgi:hypothetical protein